MKLLRNCLCVAILIFIFSMTAFAVGEVSLVYNDVINVIPGSNPDTVSSDAVISSGSDYVYIPNGQSASYSINVETESEFILEFVGKSTTILGYYDYHTVEIRLDGKTLRVINVPLAKSTSEIFNVETRPFTLPAGEHTLSIVPRSGGTALQMYEFKLNPMIVDSEILSGAYKNIILPSVIEAEDFDYATWQATDSKNYTGLYRKGTGIDIYPVDSDECYIELKSGEYTNYTFTCEKDGIYAFSLLCFDGDGVNIYFDSYVTALCIKTNTFVEKSKPVNLYIPKGIHTIKLEPLGDVIKVDNITFAESNGSYVTLDKLGEAIDGKIETEHTNYKNLYVSNSGSDSSSGEKGAPFATISRAKEEVKRLTPSMSGDIIINIESGYYELENTELFDSSLSGLNGNNVVIRGDDVDNPPVISGGKRVDGWEKYNNYMWRAPVPVGINHIRNLYINNIPATRASSKYLYIADSMYDEDTSDSLYDGFIVNELFFPENLTNHEDIELVFPIEWTSQYVKVENIEYQDDKVIIHANKDSLNNHTNDEIKPRSGKRFSIENAFELLDEPGEFYYNKKDGYIYYYPYEEENLNTADVFVGYLEKIIEISGESDEHRVHNIIFDNLDIRYASWTYPSENGFYSVQADSYYYGKKDNYTSQKIPSAVEIKNAEKIEFINNKLTCHGLIALAIPAFADDIRIEGNIVADCSASGISLGNTSSVDKKDPTVGYISITNNIITRVAAEFKGSIGIVAYYAHHINIAHNKISDVPYTGISLGWEWIHGQGENFGYFTVRNNAIDTVMTTTRDGSHIYCLGPMRYSDISYNYLTNANQMHKIGGIYFDSGCKWMHAHHNVITSSPSWFHMSGFNWIFGHRLDNNYSDITKVSTYGDHESLYFEYPSELHNNENLWCEEALSIKNCAGVESKYSHLNELSEIPSWRKSRTELSKKFLFAGRSQYDDGIYTSQEEFLTGTSRRELGKNSESFNVSSNGVTVLNPRIFNYSNATDWYWYDAEFKSEVPDPDAYPWFSMTTDNSEGIYVGYDLVVEESGAYKITAMAGAYYKEGGIEVLRQGTKDNKSYSESVIGADILISSGRVAKTGSKSKMLPCDLGVINLKKGNNKIYFRNMKSLSEPCYVGLITLEKIGDYAEPEPVKVSVRDYTQKSWFSSITISHASNTSESRELSPYTSLAANRQLTFSIDTEKDGIYMFTLYQGSIGTKYDIVIDNHTFSGITPTYNESNEKKPEPIVFAIVPLNKGTHTVKIKNTVSAANLSFFTYQRISDTEFSDVVTYIPQEIIEVVKTGDYKDTLHDVFLKRYGDVVIEAETTKTPTYTGTYVDGAVKEIIMDSKDGSHTGIQLSSGESIDFNLSIDKSGFYRVFAYMGLDSGNRNIKISTSYTDNEVAIKGPLYKENRYVCLGEIYLANRDDKVTLTLISGETVDIDYIAFNGTNTKFYNDNDEEIKAVSNGIITAKTTIYGFSDKKEDVLLAFVIYKGDNIAYISSKKIQPYDGMMVSTTIEDIFMEDGYNYTAKCFVWNNDLVGVCEICN